MTTDRLDQQLEFLRTIDALKGVERASPLIDRSRRENSAEHSWHLAMYALLLSEHAAKEVDVGRVIRMLLIHDIVEVHVGDMPIHGDYQLEKQGLLEQSAADRLYAQLPNEQGKRLRSLWEEFEAAETPDARFAKSLDRLQPLIQNIATGGGTWNEHSLTEQQVIERYGPQVAGGSTRLWDRARQLVAEFFARTTSPESLPIL